MIGLKEKIVKKKRKVEFYTHVVVTTPQGRSSRCRILHNGERLFPSIYILRHFWAFLLAAAAVEDRRSDLLKVPTVFVMRV